MKRLLFFLFLVVTTTTFATHEHKERNLLVPLTKCFNLILSEYKDSIDHCSKDKIYLKSEKIVSEENSLWIHNDSTALEIPFLCYDASGYYVASAPTNQFKPTYKCKNPECRYVWDLLSHYSTRCPICGSPGQIIGG